MKVKTFLVAAVLAMTPGLAMAMGGCVSMTPTTASACGEGQVWDADTRACVTPLSS